MQEKMRSLKGEEKFTSSSLSEKCYFDENYSDVTINDLHDILTAAADETLDAADWEKFFSTLEKNNDLNTIKMQMTRSFDFIFGEMTQRRFINVPATVKLFAELGFKKEVSDSFQKTVRAVIKDNRVGIFGTLLGFDTEEPITDKKIMQKLDLLSHSLQDYRSIEHILIFAINYLKKHPKVQRNPYHQQMAGLAYTLFGKTIKDECFTFESRDTTLSSSISPPLLGKHPSDYLAFHSRNHELSTRQPEFKSRQ